MQSMDLRAFTVLSSDEDDSVTSSAKNTILSSECDNNQPIQISDEAQADLELNSGQRITDAVSTSKQNDNEEDEVTVISTEESSIELLVESKKTSFRRKSRLIEESSSEQAHLSNNFIKKTNQLKKGREDLDDVLVVKGPNEEYPSASSTKCDEKLPEKYSMLSDISRLKQVAMTAMNNAYERTSIVLENKNLLAKTDFHPIEKVGVGQTLKTDIPVGLSGKRNTQVQGIVNSKESCSGVTFQKESFDLDNKTLFDSFISLYDDLGPPVKHIPDTFQSYREYYDIFNRLQLRDIRAVVETNIGAMATFEMCTINKVDSYVEILVGESSVSEYDLLLFSRHRNFSDLNAKEIKNTFGSRSHHPCDKDFFIGIVERIGYERGSSSPNFVIAYIATSSKGVPAELGEIYNYKIIENMSTSYREYYTLRSLRHSLLFDFILRPSEDTSAEKLNIAKPQTSVKRWRDSGAESKLTNFATSESGVGALKDSYLLQTGFSLNDTQKFAIERTLKSSKRFVLIQGPPGTGKTRVILSIISALLHKHREKKILICTPSNTAIDEIVVRMSTSKGVDYSFIRIGTSSNKVIEKYTLDYQASQESILKGITNWNSERIRILSKTSVVCSTLSSCVPSYANGIKFDYLIVDEACQATEPTTLIPMKYNFERVVLVGDPKQLPPTTFAKDSQLGYSLFERLSQTHPPIFLSSQYRMHPSICEISSQLFYNGKLITAPSIQIKSTHKRPGSEYKISPVNFINTPCGGERVDACHSYFNIFEAKAALTICKALEAKYHDSLSVVMLTPYKAQANLLRSGRGRKYESATIDAFQGNEADVVILSTVRESGLGFVCDFRRINVAITRAKYGLIILGNYHCLSKNPIWKRIIALSTGKTLHNIKKLGKFLETV